MNGDTDIAVSDTGLDNIAIRIMSGTTVNNVVFYPMIRLATETDATFAPYSNECPISGFSTANIVRTGKNLAGSTIDGVSTTSKDVTFLCTGNHLKANGTASGNNCDSPTLPLKDELFLKAGQNYIFSLNGVVANADRIGLFVRKNGQSITSYQADVSGNVPTIPFTQDADISVDAIRFRFYTANGTVINIDGYWQIEVGSTATDYEPYNGQTYIIDLDGTRYGAELDVTRGKLRVTHGIVSISQLSWAYDSTYTRFGAQLAELVIGETRKIPMLCSCFQTIDDGRGVSSVPDNSLYAGGGSPRYIYVKNSTYTNKDDFVAAYGSQKIVFPLYTQAEVDLTHTEITTLRGTNNVWHDANGDISVTYMVAN